MDVQPGGSAVLRFSVPANAKGTWQFGCFVTGHDESDQRHAAGAEAPSVVLSLFDLGSFFFTIPRRILPPM